MHGGAVPTCKGSFLETFGPIPQSEWLLTLSCNPTELWTMPDWHLVAAHGTSCYEHIIFAGPPTPSPCRQGVSAAQLAPSSWPSSPSTFTMPRGPNLEYLSPILHWC